MSPTSTSVANSTLDGALLSSSAVLAFGRKDKPRNGRYCVEWITGWMNGRRRHFGSLLEHVVIQYGSLAMMALKTFLVKLERLYYHLKAIHMDEALG
jgi:hypothetical protein